MSILSTAIGLGNAIPGLNIAGNALNLANGVGAQTLISNPFNPLKGALSRPDPIMSHQWYIELPGYDFGVSSGTGQVGSYLDQALNSIPGLSGDSTTSAFLQNAATSAISDTISSTVTGLGYEYVEEATLPLRVYQQRNVFRNGKEKKYPSSYSVGELNVNVYADAQGISLQFLNSWHNAALKAFSPRNEEELGGIWNPPAGVKRKITAVILAPDLTKVAFITYTGCWITSITNIQLDSTQGTVLKYAVDISVDDVFVSMASTSALLDATGATFDMPL